MRGRENKRSRDCQRKADLDRKQDFQEVWRPRRSVKDNSGRFSESYIIDNLTMRFFFTNYPKDRTTVSMWRFFKEITVRIFHWYICATKTHQNWTVFWLCTIQRSKGCEEDIEWNNYQWCYLKEIWAGKQWLSTRERSIIACQDGRRSASRAALIRKALLMLSAQIQELV